MPDSIEDIEKRRADRRAARENAQKAQYAKDLARVDELEIEHGDDRVRILKMPSFVAELPTLVVVVTPESVVRKRYRQMVLKAGQNYPAIGAARDMLAASCVVYPDVKEEDGKTLYERMKESWPGIHDDVATTACELADAEGKG